MKRKLLGSFLALVACLSLTGCGNTIKLKDGKTVKVTKSETKKIEFEKFDNGMITMDIPKGWKAEVPSGIGYANYTFKVTNPENTNYQYIFSLKLQGFLKSEAARAKFAKLYPSSAFGKLAAIDPQTTEAFYKVWNTNAKLANEEEFKYQYYPYLNEFEIVENFGKVNLGGDILRATFKNDAGELQQGIFTASVFSSGTYKMYGYDFAPLNVYHTIMMMTPDEDFKNWQEALDHCIGSLNFTETFLKGFTREEQTMVSTVQANAKIYDQMSDMIMDSWNKRNTSYDIISEKRSDATLGYERVYNTDTNEVYRARNGFTDNYDGTKYKPITDDMYTSTISGYIE